MKPTILIALTFFVIGSTPIWGQPPGGGGRFAAAPAGGVAAGTEAATPPRLTKFDLDFHGGTPRQLISAIEKAIGKPMNVIIRDELASTQMPPLVMKNVDVAQLFRALQLASQQTANVVTSTYLGGGGGLGGGPNRYQQIQLSYGFETEGLPPNDDSIWCFFVKRPPQPPADSDGKSCRFYSLTPYLDRGLKVEDITTAIETGWKMMGYNTSPFGGGGLSGGELPKMSFHKETSLLIVVGDPAKLETVETVLSALRTSATASRRSNASVSASPVEDKPVKTDK